MRKIKSKNYVILIVLILSTVLITLFLSNAYINKEKEISDFYNYSNKITPSEFDEYLIENSHSIIYISDKYDLSNRKFESKLKNKLNQNNLKGNFVFMDKNEIHKEFLSKLNKLYQVNIDLNRAPVVVLVIDNKISKLSYVDSNTNVNNFIEYEAFQ